MGPSVPVGSIYWCLFVCSVCATLKKSFFWPCLDIAYTEPCKWSLLCNSLKMSVELQLCQIRASAGFKDLNLKHIKSFL